MGQKRTENSGVTRRDFLKTAAAGALACSLGTVGGLSQAKTVMAASKEIKIGVLYPQSGAAARNGNLMVQGIKAAMGWVNDNGGIKSLGGAKLSPGHCRYWFHC